MITKLKFLKHLFDNVWDGNYISFYKKPIASSLDTKSLKYKISTNNDLNHGDEISTKSNIRIISTVESEVDSLYINGIAPIRSIPFNKIIDLFSFGDLFYDDFSPTIGTYTDAGTSTHDITSGNLAVGGGNGFPTNTISISEVIWSGNNWYFETEYEHTATSLNETGVWFALRSVNPAQGENIFFGLYFFEVANQVNVDIFGTNPLQGQIARSSGKLTVTGNQRVRLRAEFVETTLTVTATNLVTSLSQSVSFTYNYTIVGASNIKPNIGQLQILPSANICNIKYLKFGTEYFKGVEVLYIGDSITSGYFSGAESNRFQNLFAVQTNKSVATFAGAGDRSLEFINNTHLNLLLQLEPKKVHILLGTNDIANALGAGPTTTRLQTIITAFLNIGTQVYIGTILPRNGIDLLTINSNIRGFSNVTVIEYYNTMESSPGSGNINPLYSDDDIHPNPIGNIFMKNLQIAAGL